MPKPCKGESKKAYTKRAIPMMVKEEGMKAKAAVGKALGWWSSVNAKKPKKAKKIAKK